MDDDTLTPLSPGQMVDKFVAEVATRVRSAPPPDVLYDLETKQAISAVRQSGASNLLWDAQAQHVSAGADSLYSMDELESSLALIKSGKACLHG